MKITRELIGKLYQERLDLFKENFKTSDTPVALFQLNRASFEEDEPEIIFNKNNWNSGQDILRYFLLFTYNRCKNHIIYNNKLDIHIMFKDDTWNSVIIDRVNNDLYYTTWYKSRGRTDKITKNGEIITLDEYIEILNILSDIKEFEDYREYFYTMHPNLE